MKHSQRIEEDADALYDEATRIYRLLVARAAVRALPAEASWIMISSSILSQM